MAAVAVLNRSQDQALWDFLDNSPQATVYHTPAWRDAITATYGYEPLYLGHLEEGRLAAVLPLMFVRSWLTGRRLVSLPFANVCGPIGEQQPAGLLLEEAVRICRQRGAQALEIRSQADLNPIKDARLNEVSYFITSLVRLHPDPVRVWKGFKDRNLRTEVRQAMKKGVEVRAGTGDDLRDFYRLFSASRLRHGVPPQPPRFFENLWRYLAPKHLDLLVATHRDRCVGALITLGFGRTLAAAYIGSDEAFRSYRVHQLLFWKAMEMGCHRGYQDFDFLRTPKSNQSLRYFKQRWNAVEVDLNYLYYPEIRGTASTVEESAKYMLMTRILKRSPAFVGRLAGRVLYPHLG